LDAEQKVWPPGHPQAPLLQKRPLLQVLLHTPQLVLSVCRLTHPTPAQKLCPLGQPHIPDVHDSPVRHAVPQAPQLVGSVASTTQLPLQFCWPLGHDTRHAVMPLTVEHTCPLGHGVPQTPQLLRSLLRLTQVPLQAV
jgi:hypothetical protein